jgi:Tol biopolymer transport system component
MALDSSVAYAPGRLIFARDRALVAQAFDPDRITLRGVPVTLVPGVRQPLDLDHKTDFSVSRTGVLAYMGAERREIQLVWRDRKGRELGQLERPGLYYAPTLSPDGTRLAVIRFDPLPSRDRGFGLGRVTSDVWLLNAAGGGASRFTFDPAADFAPVWSPDGTRLVFSSNRGGGLDLYERDTSGTAADELLFAAGTASFAETWSPDGRYLFYSVVDKTTQWDVWMQPMSGPRTAVPLLHGAFTEGQVQVSPDGRWIAYASNESGRFEVYVQDFPALAGKWQISSGGGMDARWRADGRELFYLRSDRQLMAVPVGGGTLFRAGTGQPLFDARIQPAWGDARNHYDVSRDGSRFLIMTPVRTIA